MQLDLIGGDRRRRPAESRWVVGAAALAWMVLSSAPAMAQGTGASPPATEVGAGQLAPPATAAAVAAPPPAAAAPSATVGVVSDTSPAVGTVHTAVPPSLGLDTPEAIDASPLSRHGGGFPVDFVWTVMAAILVFWMQAGFAMLEAGLTRAKNTVNILMKNIMDFALGSIVFWAVGFGLMFGVSNGFFGTTGFFMQGESHDHWAYAFLLFQTVFAGTAATIVSGAMAERTRFSAYLIYTVVVTALIYPVFGSWAWGGLYQGGGWLQAPEGGLLDRMGLPAFTDFAGSTVVHSVGGWVALVGAIVVGPRLGKYRPGAAPLRGHSMALATLGVFVLWMGWFGFNAGSTTSATGGSGLYDGLGKSLALIAVNTNLAACAGAVAAMFATWIMAGKPEISMALNGALAGLVSITAPCATVTPVSALLIGLLGGTLVVFAVQAFESLRIDDPVGALSVHGVCGAFGTIAVAIFHVEGFTLARLASQLIGVGAAFLWTVSTASALFLALKYTVGLRVTPEDELDGLDLAEHGGEAYPREDLDELPNLSAVAAE